MYTTPPDPDGLEVRGNTSLASCTLADLPLELHPDGKIDEGDRPFGWVGIIGNNDDILLVTVGSCMRDFTDSKSRSFVPVAVSVS
ncbi:hypothetical protein [Oscillatoria acuminata]|uniref:Uncharacterized protein n=1 Tax=Oscillatoria acuminata PCC 6304 TaxID=56110 RepID=K9TR09_9CYAN|nr:hypothetical protein [Oscillatoria acuminata]AFY84449.1 hypothetical protein Oscil6304_4945 [Oscillatoria acuminata PCC 6304]